jgi:hypothetical protein
VNGLPQSQHGFRPGRSCTTALASAHVEWMSAAASGKVVGIMDYDLSSAFDTVSKESLLPKLEATGISGRQLDWFSSYMSGGQQCVVWNVAESGWLPVEYGVRQGSILGSILFLVIVADIPEFIGGPENSTSMYADDLGVWAVGKDIQEVVERLEMSAGRVVAFAGGNGLHLNASKTQLMFSHGAGNTEDVGVNVSGSLIKGAAEFELLGVKYDRRLTTAPHDADVARNVRQRASLVARLAHHLPRGKYLRTLASGLVLSKIAHALPAVAAPQLLPTDLHNAVHARAQAAVNDVLRTITGTKRSDHVRVDVLLQRAGIPSVNQKIVKAVAMEAWSEYTSDDGEDGARNAVGAKLFGFTSAQASRATAAGIIPVPAGNTFVMHAARVWKACPDLRRATTKAVVQAAATQLARGAPL